MKKRILSLLLLAVISASLFACGGDVDAGKTTDTVADPADSLPAGIEKKNYADAPVDILYPNWGLYRNYFHSDENTGEAIDVALFNRELKVEEYLGVDISHTMVDIIENIPSKVREITMAGDDLHQMVLAHCIVGISTMATEGMLYDLASIATVDTTTDWWNSDSMENLTVGGKQFYAVNDYMIPDPNAVIFNRDFIKVYDLEDPYDIVREGDWTFDTMISMMKTVTTDNGDGQWDINDTYGFGCPNDWFLTSFVYSADLLLLKKDADDLYTLAFGMNERTIKLADKLDVLLNGPDTFLYGFTHDFPGYNGYDETKSLSIKKGRTLFGLVTLNDLHTYRDTTVDFGLLPYPKLDSEQENYISLDWSGLMCVPASVKNPEMVGEVIELLAYYSDEEVLPAYYDLVLGEKLSRDEDSKEMLDIIFDGIVYDAGMNYFGFGAKNLGKFWDFGDEISAANWSGLSSFVAKYEEGAKTEIAQFNEKILDLD